MNRDSLAHVRRRLVGVRRRARTVALAPYAQDAGAGPASGTRPGRRYWGDCYRQAVAYMLAHAPMDGCDLTAGDVEGGGDAGELTLVHGVCRTGPVRWGHAWVELPGAVVFDGVRQQFYDRDSYCRVLGAVAEATYSVDAMLERLQVADHCGPWHRGYSPTPEAERRLATLPPSLLPHTP
jgi:hypothetical protein